MSTFKVKLAKENVTKSEKLSHIIVYYLHYCNDYCVIHMLVYLCRQKEKEKERDKRERKEEEVSNN